MEKNSNDSERIRFSDFVDKLFWFVITSSVVYCSYKFNNLTESVDQLNIKMGVVMEHMSSQDKRIDGVEEMLRAAK